MYGNVNRKKKADGTLYKDHFYYMSDRLDTLCDQIDDIEEKIDAVRERIQNVRQEKLSADSVYNFLICFDRMYDKFSDLEKKQFMKSFAERVDIYPQKQEDGRILKHIKFRFPVYFNDKEISGLSWDNESTVETICLLSRSTH